MKSNYHTHTYRCNHATGTEEEYIKKAISEGLETLGFSDHAPHVFKGDYVSPCRMKISEIGDYFETLLDLKEKYKDYINIFIGFEIEYYPLFREKTLEVYSKYPLDYLILGQHHVGNESVGSFGAFAETTDKSKLKKYVDQVIEAINTGSITYIAHPEVFNYKGDEDYYKEQYSRLIKEAVRLNIPLEVNFLGLEHKRHYPNPIFWEEASKMGATAIFGCDSHNVKDVADKKQIENGMRFADKYGLNVIDKVTFRDPFNDFKRK